MVATECLHTVSTFLPYKVKGLEIGVHNCWHLLEWEQSNSLTASHVIANHSKVSLLATKIASPESLFYIGEDRVDCL